MERSPITKWWCIIKILILVHIAHIAKAYNYIIYGSMQMFSNHTRKEKGFKLITICLDNFPPSYPCLMELITTFTKIKET